jgi:CheY-like chemotaxis protein
MQMPQRAPSKLVVIIDDDPVILDAMQGLLRGWGYKVVAAASETAALVCLGELGRRPDLIICDYRLGEGQIGVTAIERLRHAFEIPAFIVTGETASDPLTRAEHAGIDVLHKPVDPTSLNALLKNTLDRHESQIFAL